MRMRSLTPALSCVLFCGFTLGCDSDPTGGTRTTQRTGDGEEVVDQSFELNEMSKVELTQGETEQISISIDRGSDFNQRVTIEFTDGPNQKARKGVSMEPAGELTIPPDSDSVEVTIKADPQAEPGESQFTVVAKPEKGQKVSRVLHVVVNEKE